MDVAKRLDFDPTDTLTGGLQDAGQQRFQAANMAALNELQKAVADLSVTAKQKQAQVLSLARQQAEQGIGDNDLKRLKRQFDSNKATFVNIDQKQRFMSGLCGLELDIDQLTAAKDQHEAQLEREADALRALKAQNEQARAKLAATSASVSQLYGLVEQATAATAAQLEATSAVLQSAAAGRPAEADAPLEPGPGQVEAQQLVEAETAQAKELERAIAAAEAELSELEAKAAARRQKAAALRAEVERMAALASDRAKAVDADGHVRDAANWCKDLLSLMARLGGLSVASSSAEELVLRVAVRVPTSRPLPPPAGDAAAAAPPPPPVRELVHELRLSLLPREAAGGEAVVDGAWLSPPVPAVQQYLQAALDGSPDASATAVVRGVRQRLQDYWERQVLVEAAAEVFPPSSSTRGPPHVRVVLPQQTEVEVLVPFCWPSGPEPLRVVHMASPELPQQAADAVAAEVNADRGLTRGGDLVGLLRQVAERTQQRLLDAAAAAL